MSVKSARIGRFFLTAGLLAILFQGLWQLPDLQDYFFPDNYWELKLQAVNNEDWHIRDGLESLSDRIAYLEWCLAHKNSPQKFKVNWMLHFPISESFRSFSPRFAWNIDVYLASKTQVKIERKLKNLEALVNNIPPSKKLEFLRDHNNKLLNAHDFDKIFASYNNKLKDLKDRLDKLSAISY